MADMGAYLMLLTPTIPALGAFVMSGCYKFAAVQTDITGVYTNKCPTDAIRGAGRPEATHMIEVCMDQLADELGMDRLELRRKNFITEFPAETALGIVYDSGNYQGSLDKLLTHFDLEAFEQRAAEAKARGKLLGCGFSTYTEICGLAPSRVTGPQGFGLQAGLWESAMVRVHFTGAVTAYTGTSPARPGPGDDVRAGDRRPARGRPGERRDPPRRHGDGPARPGHLRLAHDGGRRRGPGPRDRTRSSTRSRSSSRTSSRRRPRTSSSPTASSPSRARRTRA